MPDGPAPHVERQGRQRFYQLPALAFCVIVSATPNWRSKWQRNRRRRRRRQCRRKNGSADSWLERTSSLNSASRIKLCSMRKCLLNRPSLSQQIFRPPRGFPIRRASRLEQAYQRRRPEGYRPPAGSRFRVAKLASCQHLTFTAHPGRRRRAGKPDGQTGAACTADTPAPLGKMRCRPNVAAAPQGGDGAPDRHLERPGRPACLGPQ